MINAIQVAYARVYDKLTRISPASWLFDFLGGVIVAKPEDMKQAPDFWLDNEDRKLPSPTEFGMPKIQMQQVAGEHFRRHIRKDIAVLSTIAAMALSAVIYSVAQVGMWAITPSSTGVAMVPTVSSSQPADGMTQKQERTGQPPITSQNCQQFRTNLAANPQLSQFDDSVRKYSDACRSQLGI